MDLNFWVLVQNLGTITLGILFAALPFLALGVLVASIIEYYIGRKKILALYGQGFWRNYGVSLLGGFIFPVCECGIVPVARKLIQSGVPISAVVMFLVSAPIFNPITIGATIAAFPATPEVWFWRIAISQIITLSLGWIFQTFKDRSNQDLNPLKNEIKVVTCEPLFKAKKYQNLFFNAYHEFTEILPYILFGAFLTSVLQTFISKNFFLFFAEQPLISIIAFMFLAFILSVCSSVDAFVILPFVNFTPLAAILAFLNFGPLIDIKNIMLFKNYFSPSFYRWYFGLITALVFIITAIIGLNWPNIY